MKRRRRGSSYAMVTHFMIAVLALMASGRTMTIDEKSHGRTVKAPVGTTLVVQLDAQLGTGYSWRVLSTPATMKALDSRVVPSQEAGAPKAGGRERQQFRFRIAKKGLQRLRLAYARPWEKDVKPARTFEVAIDSR